MNLLLDTHAFLWFVWGDSQLSTAAKNLIEDPTNDRWLSPASFWEVAIKMSVGKLALTVAHDVFFDTQMASNGIRVLPVTPRHTAALIPLAFHHRDPFDRLIIAQAIVEDMPIVSADSILDSYPIRRLW